MFLKCIRFHTVRGRSTHASCPPACSALLQTGTRNLTCRAAFGLSEAEQNVSIGCVDDKVVYLAGRFLVLYDRTNATNPRSRISQPEACVQCCISLAVSPDHAHVAVVERLWNGEQRIAFWGKDMAPVGPAIAYHLKVHPTPLP